MGTEELLIFRIENDLRKLKNNTAKIENLDIKARLKRLESINKPMFEDLNDKLDKLINPILKIEPTIIDYKKKEEFNKLFDELFNIKN